MKLKPNNLLKYLTRVPECPVRKSGDEWHSVQGFAPQRNTESEDATGVSPWSFTFSLTALITLISFLFVIPKNSFANQIGINLLNSSTVQQIDNEVARYIGNFNYINVGLVRNGSVVFTKSYGNNNINSAYEYASVSKPVTAMIIMRLIQEGSIGSINDSIWNYIDRIRDSCSQQTYTTTPITIQHLLTHRSGIPHNDQPTCVSGAVNLQFRPGSSYLYATPGYGVLGDIITAVTGRSYDSLVKEYIGGLGNAPSFYATSSWIAPGAYVYSSIEDMMRFSIGVMNHNYVSESMLYNEILQRYSGNQGFGWQVVDVGTSDLMAYHSGSNGTPKAYLRIKPRKSIAAGALGRTSGNNELGTLTSNLLDIMDSFPTASPSPSPSQSPSPTPSPSLPICFSSVDSVINSNDAKAWATNYLLNTINLDINSDNKINSFEFGYVVKNWGTQCLP